jgi:hypothetical protein
MTDLDKDIAIVTDGINTWDVEHVVVEAFDRIKKRIAVVETEKLNAYYMCVNERCCWNMRGMCGLVRVCPGRNK